MFERIQKELEPKNVAVGKYDGAFLGKPPDRLATIEEGQEFQRLFLSKLSYRKAPFPILSTGLLVSVDGSGGRYVTVEELLTARFPTDKPIDLYFEVEQGSKRNTDDDFGGEAANPDETKGQIMFNVRKSIVRVLNGLKDDLGWKSIYAEVDRAADVAFRGGIAKVVEQELDDLRRQNGDSAPEPPPAS